MKARHALPFAVGIISIASSVSAGAEAPPAVDPFTAAFVSGVGQVCSAAWAQALTGNAKALTLEERQAMPTKVFAAGGFSRGVEEADKPNLIAMKASGVPGRARIAGPGQIYAVIFGPQPECVVGGFGAKLRRAEAVAELQKSGWTTGVLSTQNPWVAYKAVGDTNDTVLLLRTEEDVQAGSQTVRATVIAAPRRAFRPGVLEALAGK